MPVAAAILLMAEPGNPTVVSNKISRFAKVIYSRIILTSHKEGVAAGGTFTFFFLNTKNYRFSQI